MVMDSISQCALCKNYQFDKGLCPAFSSIPTEIFRNLVDHRLPYKDDNGYRFVPQNKAAQLYIIRLFGVRTKKKETVTI